MIHILQMNMDGKSYFIGCEGWRKEHPAFSHRFLTIPVGIQEAHIIELFKENGVFKTVPIDVDVGKCALVTAPRSGGKGKRLCRVFSVHHMTRVADLLLRDQHTLISAQMAKLFRANLYDACAKPASRSIHQWTVRIVGQSSYLTEPITILHHHLRRFHAREKTSIERQPKQLVSQVSL